MKTPIYGGILVLVIFVGVAVFGYTQNSPMLLAGASYLAGVTTIKLVEIVEGTK